VIPGDNTPFARADANVHITPHDWHLTITPSANEIEVPAGASSAPVQLITSQSSSDVPNPYWVHLVDDDAPGEITSCQVYGNGNCFGWSSGTGLGQFPVRHFHAEITIPGDPTGCERAMKSPRYACS